MTARKCSTDNCPAMNVGSKTSKKCFVCDGLYHMPCYDIVFAMDRIFINNNIVFVCDECLGTNKNSPKRRVPSQSSIAFNPNGELGLIRSSSTSSLANLGLQNSDKPAIKVTNASLASKIEIQNGVLNELVRKVDAMKTCITEQNEKVNTNIQKNTETIDLAKNNMFTAMKVISAAEADMNMERTPHSLIHNNIRGGRFIPPVKPTTMQKGDESTSAPSSSSKGVALSNLRSQTLDAATKLAVKNRTLISGSANQPNHGLGNAVQLGKRVPVAREAKRDILPKSIYVSRLETTITVDDITSYIKNRLPNVNNDHFSLRMLVKKDQSMDLLTFISFRLSCNDELYEKFMSPTFWPGHVLIGDFFDKQPEKRQTIGDFVAAKTDELDNRITLDESSASKNDSHQHQHIEQLNHET